MSGRMLSLLLVLVAGCVLWVTGPDDRPESGRPGTSTETTNESGTTPSLRGRATPPPDPDDEAGAEVDPAAPWIAALRSKDPKKVAAAVKELIRRLEVCDLTPAEAFVLAMLPTAAEGLRELAIEDLDLLGEEALPLLGRLIGYAGKGTAVQSRSIVRWIGGIAEGADDLDEEELQAWREALRAFLPELQALVDDADGDYGARKAVLPLVALLGSDAVALAPGMTTWIGAISRNQAQFEAENPDICVSWDGTEFEIQDILSKIGSGALPAILASLDSGSGDGSYELLLAIQEMGPEALAALHDLMQDSRTNVRVSAMRGIAGAEQDDSKMLPFLQRLSRDPAASVRATAIDLLGPFGADAADELLRGLSDPEMSVRVKAAESLRLTPEAAEPGLPSLFAMARSRDAGERRSTLGVLTALGPKAAAATPGIFDDLVAALGGAWPSRADGVVLACVEAMGSFGPDAIAFLVKQAVSSDARRRDAAVYTLLWIPNLDGREVAALRSTVGERQGASRMRLAGLLVGLCYPGVFRILVDGLASAEPPVRVSAAAGLQRADAEAVSALPLLVAGLRTHERLRAATGADSSKERAACRVYAEAVSVLGVHDLDASLNYLSDRSYEVREAAARAFARAGDAGITALLGGWAGLSSAGRLRALRPLGRLARGKQFLPAARSLIVAALDDGAPEVRYAAAQIADRQFAGPEVLRTYVDLLQAKEGSIASEVAQRLLRNAAALAPFEPGIRAALPEDDWLLRDRLEAILGIIEDGR